MVEASGKFESLEQPSGWSNINESGNETTAAAKHSLKRPLATEEPKKYAAHMATRWRMLLTAGKCS